MSRVFSKTDKRIRRPEEVAEAQNPPQPSELTLRATIDYLLSLLRISTVTVSSSELYFRRRSPASVTVQPDGSAVISAGVPT